MRPLFAIVSFSFLVLALPAVGLGQDDRNDRALEFLRRLDRNGDGELTPEETPGRSRDALRRMAEQAGMDADGPVSLSRLERALRRSSGRGGRGGDEDDGGRRRGPRGRGGEGGDRFRGGPPGRGGESFRGRGGRGRGRGDDGDEDQQESDSGPSSGFASSSPQGFGSSGSSSAGGFGASSPSLSDDEMNEKYGERIMQYVDRFMSQYDRNRNGRLEQAEWEGIRWGADPKESDANGDGYLSRVELADRMSSRWGRRSNDSDRSSGRSRGDSDRSSGFRGRGRSDSSSDDGDDRFKRFAEAMIRRYDQNGNGVLEKDEWGRMRGRYADADANKDTLITSTELTLFLSNGSRGNSRSSNSDDRSSGDRSGRRGGGDDPRSRWGGGGGDPRSRWGGGDPQNRWGGGDPRSRWGGRRGSREEEEETRKSYRFLTPAERIAELLSSRIRDDFLEMDANGDGQVAMAEFSSSWDDELLTEFQSFDANGDGMITPEEFADANE